MTDVLGAPSNFLDSGRGGQSSGSYKADPDSDNSPSDKKAAFFLCSSSPMNEPAVAGTLGEGGDEAGGVG